MAGIQEPDVVDLVTYDAKLDEVVLIMIEDRPWTDTSIQLTQLKDKLANYATFALGEGLTNAYPDVAGSSIRIQLDCTTKPTAKVQEITDIAYERLRECNVRFLVNLME